MFSINKHSVFSVENILQDNREDSLNSEVEYCSKIDVSLCNKDTWLKFYKTGTEMIITKSGSRRMFPSIIIRVNQLNPVLLYSISLEILPVDNKRYRFDHNTFWKPTTTNWGNLQTREEPLFLGYLPTYAENISITFQRFQDNYTKKSSLLVKRYDDLKTNICIDKEDEERHFNLLIYKVHTQAQKRIWRFKVVSMVEQDEESGMWIPLITTDRNNPPKKDRSRNSTPIKYIHPASPTNGATWQEMTAISFEKIKLTNSSNSVLRNHLPLSSMHRYFARVEIRQEKPFWIQHYDFPETTFIAVTAYQNHKVANLKMTLNPLTKNFSMKNTKKKSKKVNNQNTQDATVTSSSKNRNNFPPFIPIKIPIKFIIPPLSKNLMSN